MLQYPHRIPLHNGGKSMSNKKTLKELTLKDNFMFGAVMSDENNCRRLLEMTL